MIEGRKTGNHRRDAFLAYDLEGPVQPEMSWLPVSYRKATGEGFYLMRMEPGARTLTHDHAGYEDFLILEGELIDEDGLVLGPGDHVSYAPGTRHHSHSPKGCLIAVCEWRPTAGTDGK